MSISISIVGSGNVAFHLIKAFKQSNINIDAVITNDIAKSSKKIRIDGINWSINKNNTNLSSEIIILAVNDAAIENVLSQYQFNPKAIIVHTSGAVSIEKLKKSNIPYYGVFYPLQSLTIGCEILYKDLPIYVEGSSRRVEKKLLTLANKISNKIGVLNSNQRIRVHLAAVLVNNFTNYLLSEAETILKDQNIELSILEPLIRETVDKALSVGPSNSQTGPAYRGDKRTINKHLDLLSEDRTKKIYKLISQQIASKKSR